MANINDNDNIVSFTIFAEDCKDHSQLCSRVKIMNMCKVPLYKKQCCASCH